MNNYFIFDGVLSNHFNIVISGESTWGAPEFDGENVSIPGRNGDLVKSNKRYKNVEFEYPCSILDTWKTDFDAFKAFAATHMSTYFRLEDTYHPGQFIMAKIKTIDSISYDDYNESGTFNLKLDRKPQRFLKDIPSRVYTAVNQKYEGTFYNHTNFEALPIVKIEGYGVVTIGKYTINIAKHTGAITIDCNKMNAYDEKGSLEANTYTGLPTGFIFLEPGDNKITLTPASGTTLKMTIVDPGLWTV